MAGFPNEPPNGAYATVFTPEAYGATGYGTVAAATGSGTDNTTALNNAIAAAAAVGGTVELDSKFYPATGPVVAAGGCRIVGKGVQELGMGASMPGTAPYLQGSVILITGAAHDGLQLTGTATSVDLDDFGILFAPSIMLTNTGHGVNAQASQVVAPGHGIGAYNATWKGVKVFGHDGNHYGFRLCNSLEIQTIGCRAYGGGVMEVIADSAVIVSGNMVHVQPFGCTCVAGTAHAYAFSAFAAPGSGGALNLMQFHRPQVNFADQSGNAGLGNPTKPTASQYLWHSSVTGNWPSSLTVYDPDLEADDSVAHPCNIGDTTRQIFLVGFPNINTSGAVTAPNYTQKPSLTPGTALGTAPSVSILNTLDGQACSDLGGVINLTCGTTPAGRTNPVVTINLAQMKNPVGAIIQPYGDQAAQITWYVQSYTSTSITIAAETTLTAAVQYILGYVVVPRFGAP